MNIKYKIFNLTLIELLISLGILAALASVTLSMLEESTSQERFRRTYEIGNKIRGIINAPDKNDGVSRFISDMGRLPVVISTDEGMRLAELYNPDIIESTTKWSSAATFNNSDSSLPSDDSELDFPDDFITLNLPCGWAGPYLYNHKTQLFDGWNNEWRILDQNYNIIDESTLALNTFIYGIESLGGDNSIDNDSWSSKNQEFRFNTSVAAAANSASLIVTVMVRDNSTLNPMIRPVIETGSSSASTWATDTEYSLNSEIQNGIFIYRCVNILANTKGKSGSVEPSWDTVATGNQTVDKAVVWQYYGASSDEADWYADCVYSKNDKVKDAAGHAFICVRIRPLSGGSIPVFNTDYKDITNDGDISWQCIYPDPAVMSHLRVAVFMPRISRTEKGARRFMALRENTTLTTDLDDSVSFSPSNFFAEMLDETASWIAYNQVELKNLTPGSRKLYVYGFFKNGSVYRNKRGSGVLDVKLSPGVNRVTVYLTNEL